jgi:signal transduction histidine kinase
MALDPQVAPFTGKRRTDRMLGTLMRVNQFIASVTDLPELLRRIMQESERLLDAEASSVFLYDEVTDDLYFEVVLGEPEVVQRIRGIRIRVSEGKGFAGECALTRQPINCSNAQEDPRHNPAGDKLTGFKTRALIAVPLVHKEKLIGVLEVLNRRGGGAFDDDDLRIMGIIANQAAIAIENARLIESNIHNERLAAMGTAMAGISHGIKNILTGVRGSASLIEFALSQAPPNIDMIQETWPILVRNERKISELIQDMLLYSKRRDPELEGASICELCREVSDLCLERANLAGVALELDVPEEDPLETAIDVKAMHDCVLNLVSNAIDATPSGDEAFVRLSCSRADDGKHILIRVEDNGTGIPEQIQKKIWEPFFSTKGKKGTGLGLAMTRKTIEEHGGAISLLSKEGEGTTFTIYLPIREASRRAEPPSDAESAEG